MIKIATVCTGIGSPEQALKNLNIPHEIVFGCEIDKFARATYLANFEPGFMEEDMTQCDWIDDKYYSDLFIGGIPCQSFSLAGRRLGEEDPRGLLFYDFYRYVKIQQPKYFIVENVKGLLSDDKGRTFRNWIQLLGRSENTHINMFNHPDSLEYNLHWTVLNTKDFGLPQNRERVFIIGIRKDLPNTFRFPAGWWLDKRLKDVLEENVDEKYYLNITNLRYLQRAKERGRERVFITDAHDDLSTCITSNLHKGLHNNGETLIKEPICAAMRGRNPDNPSSRVAGQCHEQVLEFNSQGTTNCLSTVQKDNLIIEPSLLKIGQLDGFESEGRIYDSSGIARTIKDGGGVGSKAGWYNVGNDAPYQIRRLTPLECFRLQGFPDEFFYKAQAVNSDTQLYKQAGNTISVPVIEEIIKQLIN